MKTLLIFLIGFSLLSCASKDTKEALPLLPVHDFETVLNGDSVGLYTLRSGKGMTMQVTNYGAHVINLFVPDRNNEYVDVALGYSDINQYLEKGRFMNSIVGRFANRIGKGRFSLDGISYQLPLNDGNNTLHGGYKGLDVVVWKVDEVSDNSIRMSYVSPDGEEGFPATLNIHLNYILTPENEFKIVFTATTDKPTIVNLSFHSFFNLKGEGNGTITDHILTVNSGKITSVDNELIPSGDLMFVGNTPFDFRKPALIGNRIGENDEQLKNGSGYDHNWVIDRKTEKELEWAATVLEPQKGIQLEVYSDQPGLQFYSGNFFDGKDTGKYGKPFEYRSAFALETQKFPDSPNHADFPSTRLNPGEIYSHTCIYKFSVKE